MRYLALRSPSSSLRANGGDVQGERIGHCLNADGSWAARLSVPLRVPSGRTEGMFRANGLGSASMRTDLGQPGCLFPLEFPQGERRGVQGERIGHCLNADGLRAARLSVPLRVPSGPILSRVEGRTDSGSCAHEYCPSHRRVVSRPGRAVQGSPQGGFLRKLEHELSVRPEGNRRGRDSHAPPSSSDDGLVPSPPSPPWGRLGRA